jgi:hypothetical protein
MSETLRFALRIATVFPPKTSHRLVPAGLDKPAIYSEHLHRRLLQARRTHEQLQLRMQRTEALLAQHRARLQTLTATPGTSHEI